MCVLKIAFSILGIKHQNINDLKENKNISVESPKIDCSLLFNIQSLEMRDTNNGVGNQPVSVSFWVYHFFHLKVCLFYLFSVLTMYHLFLILIFLWLTRRFATSCGCMNWHVNMCVLKAVCWGLEAFTFAPVKCTVRSSKWSEPVNM